MVGPMTTALAMIEGMADPSDDLPEELQAVAARRVAEISAKRSAALAEADRLSEELRIAVIDAVRTGVGRKRVRDIARVGPATLYSWLDAAGIERPKRRRAS